MSSLKDIPYSSGNGCRNSEERISRWNFFSGRWSRRCVMALLLFLLLIIEQCRNESLLLTLVTSVVLGHTSQVNFDAIGEWSWWEIDRLMKVNSAVMTIAQIPGAILIFKFSSHKYLITTVIISSILHMLTPIGLHHHSITLVILVLAETAISASVKNAVISMWKDWAPPSERTKLITFCFLARFVGCATSPYYQSVFIYFTEEEHFYITGIAGLVWALFWYCSFSNVPENDPQISDKELRYLEDEIPTWNQLKIRLRGIPWKGILTSKQVYIASLVFFKMAFSFQTIYFGGIFFRLHLYLKYDAFWMFIFFSVALILVPLVSAKLADTLIQKSGSEVLSIRLKFLFGGFLPQCLLLLGTLLPSELAKGIFFILSYLFFAASFPGFITMPLDLSPRYVSILLGFIFTAHSAGILFFEYFLENTVSFMNVDSIGWLFLFDVIITLICMIVFFLYADYQDQPWSAIPMANSVQNDTMQENEDVSDKIHNEA